MRGLLIALSCLVATGFAAAGAGAEERLALVVGAGDYEQSGAAEEQGFIVPSSLANALNDAKLVGDALEAAGYTVRRVENPDKGALLTALGDLAEELRAAGEDAVGVFYFAGHGAQGKPPFERDIDNYLVPIGTQLRTETDLESEAVGLSRISAQLSGSGAASIVIILDACRNFALPAADRATLNPRGLAEARALPGTLIAYATAPGSVASDGPAGGNGPYAAAFAREVEAARGARLEDIFYTVRQDVLRATGQDQVPWENSSLVHPVTMGEGDGSAASQTSAAADQGGGAGPVDVSRLIAGDTFRECDACPEMAVIPDGAFAMGVSERDYAAMPDRLPQHTVTFAAPFAVGKFEVTIEEWVACVRASACDPEAVFEDELTELSLGRGAKRPVRRATWDQAQAYVAWLSAQTGATYRLLTESEWEYAARAGSTGRFSWGDDDPVCETTAPNGASFDCSGNAPQDVGLYPANAFGLHDMHGNVEEWVEDCYHGIYETAPADGSAWVVECGLPVYRVFRGGSYFDSASSSLHVARRGKGLPGDRYSGNGLRVARTLAPAQ
jgi:formylglycine-generating enzyme required for sulfatase activity